MKMASAAGKTIKVETYIESETVVVIRCHMADAYQAMAVHDVLTSAEDSVRIEFSGKRVQPPRTPPRADPIPEPPKRKPFPWARAIPLGFILCMLALALLQAYDQ